ncbi:MAG: hypothetical protein JNJ57_03980 [Saprospiraceae bacterium]|nr:hypothetical protein [Saprospiraceae bacterium]
MNDFLKKVKSVFIVEEGASGNTESTDNKTTVEIPSKETGATTTSAPVQAEGSLNNKFLEVLATALEKNNQEGFDYFEFRQALKNLSKMSMDEQTRYQSAYAMAQTMGITSAKLVESAQHYLNVLATEKTRFSDAHAQQRAKLIGNKEEEIKNLDQMVQQKSAQIAQLTKEIEEHRKNSELIRKEINDSTVKIETTKADFEVTFTSVMEQLQNDVVKIQQYLK